MGDLVNTCNSDGSGYLPDPVDCTNSGTSCCEGACRSPAIYAIDGPGPTGGSSELDDDGTRLNTFRITNGNAYLMQIGQGLRTTRAMTLGWYVYEAVSRTSNFVRIFEKRTTSSTVTNSQTSGPICVKLDQTRYYSIGVGWEGTRDITVYYYSVTFPAPGVFPVLENQSVPFFPPGSTLFWGNASGGSLYAQQLTVAR